jgi:hypothetical protein
MGYITKTYETSDGFMLDCDANNVNVVEPENNVIEQKNLRIFM